MFCHTKSYLFKKITRFGKYATLLYNTTLILPPDTESEGAGHEEGKAAERHPPASKLTGCLHLVIDT